MALDNKEFAALAAIFTALGSVIPKIVQYLRPSKKEKTDTAKVKIESRVLTDAEQREQDRFTEEQLLNLEKRFKELQLENVILRDALKAMTINADISEKKLNEALNDITFLRIELASKS